MTCATAARACYRHPSDRRVYHRGFHPTFTHPFSTMHSEDALPYDGPLSTYQEWDAFLYGLVVGVALSIDAVRRDIRAEPSKLIAGALVGYTLAKSPMNDP